MNIFNSNLIRFQLLEINWLFRKLKAGYKLGFQNAWCKDNFYNQTAYKKIPRNEFDWNSAHYRFYSQILRKTAHEQSFEMKIQWFSIDELYIEVDEHSNE